MMHEYVHVRQKHSVDILLAEILCLLQWFNPFAWMLRKYIRQNLEFLADNEVIRHGIAPREYQLLLLKVMGVNPHLVAPFGFSFLKKRIKMMNKNKTPGIQAVRFLFALPLLLIVSFSFRTYPIPDGKNDGKDADRFSVRYIPGPSDTTPNPPKPIVPGARLSGTIIRLEDGTELKLEDRARLTLKAKPVSDTVYLVFDKAPLQTRADAIRITGVSVKNHADTVRITGVPVKNK